jgi:hypothetical protein
MPKPFKPTRPFALPAGAEIVDVGGKSHVRLKQRGRSVLYRVTKDGTKYFVQRSAGISRSATATATSAA